MKNKPHHKPMQPNRLYDFLFLLLVFLILLLTSMGSFGQGVGINTTTPDPSSILDLNASDRGLLAPRMTHSQRNLISSPANGLLIYQTNSVGNESAGLYYYDAGLPAWVRFSDQNKDAGWRTTGNTGLNSGINFLGTTDTADLVLRTNNVSRMRIADNGKIGMGPLLPGITYPYSRLDISDEDGNNSDLVMRVAGGPNGYAQLIFNKSRGTLSAPATTQQGDFTGVILGRAWDGGNWTNNSSIIFGIDSAISAGSAPGNIIFSTNSKIQNGEKMRLTRNGRLGLGTNNPFSRLHMVSNDSALSIQTITNSNTYGWSGSWFVSHNQWIMGHYGYGNINAPRWSNKVYAGSVANIPFVLTTSDVERMRIQGNGDVIVGDTMNYGKFKIQSNSTLTSPQLSIFEADTADFGRIAFLGKGTSRFWHIAGRPETADTLSDMNIYNSTSGNLMTFKWGGNIGIGTSSPSVKLELSSPGLIPMRVRSTATNGYSVTQYISNTNLYGHIGWANSAASNLAGQFFLGTQSNAPVIFTTGDVERMRLTTNGNLGLGTNNPTFKIDVVDVQSVARLTTTGNANGSVIELTNANPVAGSILGAINFNTGSNNYPGQIAYTHNNELTIRTNGTEKMRIESDGSVGILTNNPGAELEVNGFTKLGGVSAPAIKMVKLTATSSSVQGGAVDIALPVPATKVLSVDVHIEYIPGAFVPKNYLINPGYEFDYFMTGSILRIFNRSANSSNLLSKPVKVMVTYEE